MKSQVFGFLVALIMMLTIATVSMLRGRPVWTKLKAAYLSLSGQSNQRAQQDAASFAFAVFQRVENAAEAAADGASHGRPPHPLPLELVKPPHARLSRPQAQADHHGGAAGLGARRRARGVAHAR